MSKSKTVEMFNLKIKTHGPKFQVLFVYYGEINFDLGEKLLGIDSNFLISSKYNH